MNDGDRFSSDELFASVYSELKRIAESLMRNERTDHTLQTTALINEAYVRLVNSTDPQRWDGKAHFLSSAAESMRRILVDHARKKLGKKRGGGRHRHQLKSIDDEALASMGPDPELILDVSDALESLAQSEPQAAELIRLRFFAGLSIAEAASVVGIPQKEAYPNWAYAKARMGKLLKVSEDD